MGNVTGLNKVKAALKKSKGKLEKDVERALKKAGLLLQRKAQKLTPVDTGALRNSALTIATGKGFDTEVLVAFAQDYAIYVHEILENVHPVGQAKFLEQPAREMQGELANIIKIETNL